MARDVLNTTRSIGTTTSLEVGTVTKTDTPPVMVEFFPFFSMEILKVWGRVLLNVALPFAYFFSVLMITGLTFGFVVFCAMDEPFISSFESVVISPAAIMVSMLATVGAIIYTVDHIQESKRK